MVDKRAWRRQIRAERAETTIDHHRHVSTLARFLAEMVPEGRRIVIYDALSDEVSLDGLIAGHREPGERFALTRTPDAGHDLTLHPYGAATERHRYGYRQPRADGPTVADGDVGAVLVPGLAFDRFGNRLGRGAGYYDRFLARLDRSVLRIGMTAGIIVDRLPTEAHDVAMTHLATADAVIEVPLDRDRAGSGDGGGASADGRGGTG